MTLNKYIAVGGLIISTYTSVVGSTVISDDLAKDPEFRAQTHVLHLEAANGMIVDRNAQGVLHSGSFTLRGGVCLSRTMNNGDFMAQLEQFGPLKVKQYGDEIK